VCEQEVQKIIHLQSVANQLPDAFVDTKNVVKSYIPAANAPARIEIPIGHPEASITNESKTRRKRGRPLGSKNLKPRKSKNLKGMDEDATLALEKSGEEKEIENEKISQENDILDNDRNVDNSEISINYVYTGVQWNRKDVILDDKFAYSVAIDVVSEDDDIEPKSVDECRQRKDWSQWKEAIQAELKSLEKREVFGPVVHTPKGIKPVGYKWVFVRKRNEKNEVVRYKARLVAQGFSQIPGIDYDETYSPVVDATTLRFLIGMTVFENLHMHLMDVVTAYLYGSLDTDIYMRVPEGIKISESNNSQPRGLFSIKLKRALYGLKQSGRMWYNRLSEYLMKEGYKNNTTCPCVFIKKSKNGFAIIAVYVDDLNIVGTSHELDETAKYLR